MKKFEIVKTTAEISWKERNEIKEGCTMYDVDPEKIASFGTKEEAEKELKKYKTDVCASGSLFTVEEFSIQENEYDEDGEWIGGGAPQKQKEKLNSMPVINPGYVITQKIIHTLQCMNYEGAQWAYQVVRENKGITKEVINKIENDREMTEEEKKKFEKKIVKSFNRIKQNKEWMAKKDGEESYDD